MLTRCKNARTIARKSVTTVQGHPKSLILIRDFLVVIVNNSDPILHRFSDIKSENHGSRLLNLTPRVNPFKILDEPNIAKKRVGLLVSMSVKISRSWFEYNTDAWQTDRQTDRHLDDRTQVLNMGKLLDRRRCQILRRMCCIGSSPALLSQQIWANYNHAQTSYSHHDHREDLYDRDADCHVDALY